MDDVSLRALANQLDAMLICCDCGIKLTDEERYYYEFRCEKCEYIWMDRVDKWMQGGEDAEMEMLYGTL